MPACGTRQSFKAANASTSLSICITDDQRRNMTISGFDSRTKSGSSIPPDDLMRILIAARSNDQNLPHIGLVGDTYTILLAGKDTAGRFCLIDMHIPPGGGPPPHRHDFEETFIILEGQIEATFRGAKSVASAGQTVHIPANAPSVSKQERPPGAPVMHLLSCRTRRLLRPGRRARRNPHDRAPKTRRE